MTDPVATSLKGIMTKSLKCISLCGTVNISVSILSFPRNNISMSIILGKYILRPYPSYCTLEILPKSASIPLQISSMDSPAFSGSKTMGKSSSYTTTALMNFSSQSNPQGSVSIKEESLEYGTLKALSRHSKALRILYFLSPILEPSDKYSRIFFIISQSSSSPNSTRASSDILLLSHTGSKTSSIVAVTTPGTSSIADFT